MLTSWRKVIWAALVLSWRARRPALTGGLKINILFYAKNDTKIKGGQHFVFYYRIYFALDCYITDFHALCPKFMYLLME